MKAESRVKGWLGLSIGLWVAGASPGGAIASVMPSGRGVVREPIRMAQQFDCRQVAPERGAPFYSTLPQQSRAASDFLPRGSRVSLEVTSGAIRAQDGQFYHFVTYPFGSANTVTGYIPVQTRTSNGVRNTLEPCRRRMW